MCGIIGQIAFEGPNTTFPDLSLIRHRGPDGRGEWTNDLGNVYFGHARLAILDPTPTGQQPMKDGSNRFTITFNGEIYNHLELREILPGVKWKGTSDTETLLELFAVRGLDAIPLLQGIFAFALHDNDDNSVLLVRDRLGIKPLWLQPVDNRYNFASEVRPLLCNEARIEFTTPALSEYIGFGRMPTGGRIIGNIQAVLPGHWIKLGNGRTEQTRWWPDDSFAHVKVQNRPQAIARVRQLVTTAVESNLLSDVGVGAFLSGGIDSSIVAVIAGKALGKNLKTFTVGFPGENSGFDERSIARKVAERIGSEHCEIEIQPDTCLDWVTEAVSRLDLPSVDALNTFIVSKAVSKTGLKVALSGLGGDELFGGYPSFRNIPLLAWLAWLPPVFSRKLVKLMPQALREKLSGLKTFDIKDLTVARRRFASVPDLMNSGLEDGAPAVSPPRATLDTMGTISWSEIQGYMIPMLLRDSDQMSMAVGLEIRVPFLEHDLLEEVLLYPQRLKKGRGVKPLLVAAFRDDLPTEVYDRPKQGFALPMDAWMRGPLAAFTGEGLAAAGEFLEMAEPLVQKKRFEKGNLHWTRLWTWSVLGHWLANQNALRKTADPPNQEKSRKRAIRPVA